MSNRFVCLSFCLVTLLAANTAAALAVQPEFPMNGDAVGPGPLGDQTAPAIAHNPGDDTYYAVWESMDASGYRSILGARIGEDGELLDRTPRVICSYPTACNEPKVAFHAGYYLVVWSDIVGGNVLGRRLYSNGYPAGGVISIATSSNPEYEPSVTGGANKFVVVYTYTYTSSQIWLYAAEIAPSSGAVLRRFVVIDQEGPYNRFSEPSVITRVDAQGVHFDVAFRASDGINRGIWVLYSQNDDLSQGGWVLEARTGTDSCGQPHEPTLARGTLGYDSLVVFTQLCPDGVGGYREDLFISQPGGNWARRVTWTPSMSETNPELVYSPWDGSFWISWHSIGTSRRPLVAKLNPWAFLVGAIELQEVSAVSTPPAIATNGRAVLVAWGDARSAGYGQDLFASRVSSDLEDLDPVDLHVATAFDNGHLRQEEPAVASTRDGKLSLLVWTDRFVDPHGDIRGVLVDGSGQVLADINISAEPWPEGSPAVASNGEHFFVVWDATEIGPDYGRIQGAVVLDDGTVGPVETLSRTDPYMWSEDPAVTFVPAPGVYVAAWQSDYGNTLDIYGNPVATYHDVAKPLGEIEISLDPGKQRRVALGGGVEFALAAWEEDGRGHPTVNVFGAKLRAWDNFKPGPELELTEDLDAHIDGHQYWPAVACDVAKDIEHCVVTVSSAAWQDPELADIVALRTLVPQGQDDLYRDGWFPVSDAEHEQRRSTVVFDEDHFFSAWEDFRGGFPAIYAAKFDLGGSVWEPAGDRLSLGLDPAAADLDYDRYLVVDQQATWGIHRVIGRVIDP